MHKESGKLLSFVHKGQDLPGGEEASRNTWVLNTTVDSEDWAETLNQLYRIDYNFDDKNFNVFSIGAGVYLDFTANDSKFGL